MFFFSDLKNSLSFIIALFGQPSENFGVKYVPYAELGLLLLVFFLWFLSIALCLSKYKKLRAMQPYLTPYPGQPMHIEESKKKKL
jgi:hypothetical protein